jgi:hypothetical protein
MAQVNDFDALYNVSPGKHLYQFYKGLDDYMSVVTAFFRAGLEKGEACLWLVPAATGIEKAKGMAELLIPGAERYLETGQLEIRSGEDWYLTGGRFDADRAVNHAAAALEEMRAAGYKILRGVGDAAAIPHQDWPAVHVYEQKMADFIPSAPLIALCTYPILQCSIADTRAVVEEHDSVLVGRF